VLLTDEKFLSSYEEQESRKRLETMRTTARDIRLHRQQNLIDDYGLRLVSPCSRYSSTQQREVMFAFVQTLGQTKMREQFRTFCRMNASLGCWYQDWQNKMMENKNPPEERPERLAYLQSQLTKGVMYIAGFTSRTDSDASIPPTVPLSGNEEQSVEQSAKPSLSSLMPKAHDAAGEEVGPQSIAASSTRTPSSAKCPRKGKKRRHDSIDDMDLRPPTVNEEAGDICSLSSTDTAKIEQRLTHQGGNKWLRENAKWIAGQFGNKIVEKEFYAPRDVMRLARTMLNKAGLMVEPFAQKRPRSRTDRRRKAVTCWRISNQSIAITSMLELAYVIRTHGLLHYTTW